jgi:hypothetical protein
MKSLFVAALIALAQVAHAAPETVTTTQARAEHLKALTQAANGDTKGAIRALQGLSLKTFAKGEKDRVFISMGRLNYEIGNFDNAIAAYGKVEKTGPNWMESLEETAWAQFRLGHPQETIAKLKTVINPVFKSESTSEAYFLLGLAQLRVCDFKAVFKTIELFKKNFSDVTKQLEATNKNDPKLKEIGETVQKLNLVEAETIQRLYVDENGKKRKGSVAKIERTGDEISFPSTEDDEFWLDEVDAYKVSLKGCLPPGSNKTAKNEVVK